MGNGNTISRGGAEAQGRSEKDRLYVVTRVPDHNYAEVRRIANGQLQLYWTAKRAEATALPRAKAQALAAMMAIGAAPYGETIMIEEALV